MNHDINIKKTRLNCFRQSKVPGEFMLQLRVPGNLIDAKYLSVIQHIAQTWGDGLFHIGTRQTLNATGIKYEHIPAVNAYIEDYIKSIKINSDFTENEINFVSKDEMNEWLHYRYDRLPLFERVEEMAKKLSQNFYKGSNKKAKTFAKLLRENSNLKKDFKEIYKGFWQSSYSKYNLPEATINAFINQKVINYEDALLFTYIKGHLQGFAYEGNIKQVVIDEAQDYNKLQYIIAKHTPLNIIA